MTPKIISSVEQRLNYLQARLNNMANANKGDTRISLEQMRDSVAMVRQEIKALGEQQ